MTWRFDWITSWGEIWSDSFLAQWHEWMQTSPTSHVFFHPALVRAWVETYMPLRRIEPRFLLATQDGCTVFLPMVLWRRNWKNAFQRVLVPVGYSDYDYHDPLVGGSAKHIIWSQFWVEFCSNVRKEFVDGYDILELNGVREAQACHDVFVREETVCPWRDLRQFADGGAFLASLGQNLRGDLRRRQRRMSEVGNIQYKVFATEEKHEATDALREFVHTHSSRWPQAYKAPAFFRNIVRLCLSAEVLHFSILNIGGEVVAWHLGFIDNLRFYWYMPAYKAVYAKLAPGKMLLYYCTLDAIDRRLKMLDLLKGKENYKVGWANHSERLYTLQFENGAALSRLRNVAVNRVKPLLMNALTR